MGTGSRNGLLALAMLAGCGVDEEGRPPAASEVDEALPSEEDLPPGAEGWLRVRRMDGAILTLPYVEEDGVARVGDVGFGPIEEIRRMALDRASPVIDTAQHWPDGVVPFTFDPNEFPAGLTNLVPQDAFDTTECLASALPAGSRYDDDPDPAVNLERACDAIAATLGAMFDWQQEVPGIRFVPFDGTQPDQIIVTARNDFGTTRLPTDYCAYNLYDVATLENHFGTTGGADNLLVNLCGRSGVRHELGHALGFWHEQGRPDRDLFVTHDGSCDTFPADVNNVRGGAAGFQPMGPFDFDSIMLYASYDFVQNPATSVPPDRVTFDATSTGLVFELDGFMGGIAYQTDGTLDGYAVTVVPDPALGASVAEVTRGAVQGTLASYEVHVDLADLGLATTTPGVLSTANWTINNFTATGDPEIDPTCPALVRIGTDPFADGNATFTDNGALSPGDVSAAFRLYGGTHADGSPAVDDEGFGGEIAHGDFDGDGLPDLAIAVPGDDGGAGSVALYRGVYRTDVTGVIEHLPWRLVTNLEVWDLDVGDFDGDGFDDLVIGHRGTPDELGQVDVFFGEDANDFSTPLFLSMGATTVIQPPSSRPPGWGTNPGARLGAALAVGDLDQDGLDDLVIGAPGANAWSAAKRPASLPLSAPWNPAPYQRAGTALVYRGSDSDPNGLVPWEGALDPHKSTATGSHVGGEYGTALDVGDYDDDGCPDVAVGAPFAYRVDNVSSGSIPAYETAGDHQFARPVVRTGQVYLFHNFRSTSSGACFSGSNPLRFKRHVSTHEEGSEFGAALASGPIVDATDDLVVGAPNAVDDEPPYVNRPGAAYVYGLELVAASSPLLTATDELHERDHGVCESDGDRFGETVATGKLHVGEPFETVAIGAPSRDIGCGGLPPELGEGGVFLWKLGTSGLDPLDAFEALAPAPSPEDGLGAALAFRPEGTRVAEAATLTLVGQPGLSVGAPGAEVGTTGIHGGLVHVLETLGGPLVEAQEIGQQ